MSVLKTFTVTGHIATAFVARFLNRTKSQQILDLRAQNFSVRLALIVQVIQGHPTSIFGKYLFGRRFEI